MESRNNDKNERRRGSDRRRRDFTRLERAERRSRGGRRRANLAGWMSDASSSALIVHRLLPADGNRFLSPLRVLTRIEAEFAYVEADGAEGAQRAAEIILRLKKEQRGSGDSRLEHLLKVQGDAVSLRLGDDPSSETEYLSVIVIPGEPLILEFESPEHAQAADPLLKRCARALGYSIIRPAGTG